MAATMKREKLPFEHSRTMLLLRYSERECTARRRRRPRIGRQCGLSLSLLWAASLLPFDAAAVLSQSCSIGGSVSVSEEFAVPPDLEPPYNSISRQPFRRQFPHSFRPSDFYHPSLLLFSSLLMTPSNQLSCCCYCCCRCTTLFVFSSFLFFD